MNAAFADGLRIHVRLERHGIIRGPKLLPLDLAVEPLRPQLLDALVEPRQALARVLLAELANGLFVVADDGLRPPLDLVDALVDRLVDLDRAAVGERGLPAEELVEKDAETPPVYRMVVALLLDNLRGHVLRRATHCVCPPDHDLGDAHIAHLRLAFL